MSAPMVCGAEVARVQMTVRRELGLWLRLPVWEALGHLMTPVDVRTVLVDSVRRRMNACCCGSERLHLGRLALALTALENYYLAIGSTTDAKRMRDMRWPVDELQAEQSRIADQRRACENSNVWMSAFAAHPWPDAVAGALGSWGER